MTFRQTKQKGSSLLPLIVSVMSFAALFSMHRGGKVSQDDAVQIGKIIGRGPDVKRKGISEADFTPIKNSVDLRAKDTLFVGPGSSATLDLGENGKFELTPNSVVIVVIDIEKKVGPRAASTQAGPAKKAPLKMQLVQGDLRYSRKPAQVEAPSLKVEVASGATIDMAQAEELRLSKDSEGHLQIHESNTASIDLKIVNEQGQTELRSVQVEKPVEAAPTPPVESLLTKSSPIANASITRSERKTAKMTDAIMERIQEMPSQPQDTSLLGSQPAERKWASWLEVATEAGSSTVQATDKSNNSTANLSAKAKYGVTATYIIPWSTRIFSTFYFSQKSVSFNKSLTGEIRGSQHLLSSYGADLGLKFNSRHKAWVGLGLHQSAFLKGVSVTAVTFDLQHLLQARVALRSVLVRKGDFDLGVRIEGGGLGPKNASGYNSTLNYRGVGAFFVEQNFSDNWALELGLQSSRESQNTSLVKQTLLDHAFYARFGIPLGKRKEGEE